MPAKMFSRVSEGNTYSHIFNTGAENLSLFRDDQDYEVFLSFLESYLNPIDPETSKKTFMVRGRSFEGVPHQPKNHFSKVALIAYNLAPTRFDLLLHQIADNAIERLMRSLSTRYSIYFNKKYNRSGTLFAGPYKSIKVKDHSDLLYLTGRLHQNTEGRSSLPEYIGARKTSWVHTNTPLHYLDSAKETSLKGIDSYKEFVEKYLQLSNEVTETGSLTSTPTDFTSMAPDLTSSPDQKSGPNFLVYTGITVVFFLLVGFGIHHVQAGNNTPMVLSAFSLGASQTPAPTSSPIPTPSPEPKTMITIKITDGADGVNIREMPSTSSNKIGKAQDGQSFELVSVGSGWYEVKLPDGLIGFISERYVSH